MSAPYPWLAPVWQRLTASRARPAQTLLIGGPAGVGKRALAQAWAKTLLCEAPTATLESCGVCAACHWFDAGTHPDLRVVTLAEKEKDGVVKTASHIEVDQARDAVAFIQLSTHRAGRRVLIVDPADALNPASANALLKALEEPPPGTVFLLVADRVRQLLPTIRSRAQRIDLGIPAREAALAWLNDKGLAEAATRLALAGGAPLRAQDSGPDGTAARNSVLGALADPARIAPVAQAESWKDIPPATLHAIAYRWLADLLGASQGATPRFNPDFAESLKKLGPRVAVGPLLKLAREHAASGRYLAHPLNQVLQREAWLLHYQDLFAQRPSA